MYVCPMCGESELAVHAVQHVTAYIDEHGNVWDDSGGDTEWDDDSYTRCTNCRFEGKNGDFWKEDE